MNNRPVVCIQGPTASGKSTLSESIASCLKGEIISADSMQIYRGMDIGTAKVLPQDRHVPYHCIDILDPGAPYSAALFQQDARQAMHEIWKRQNHVVLCGGTGFYVKAAIDEMDFAPGEQSDNPIRQKYEALLKEHGPLELHDRLRQIDPSSASLIHPNNSKRVIRALEMQEQGDSYARRKDSFKTVPPKYERIKIALNMNRELLYRRIETRVDQMFDDGLVEEVKRLLDAGFEKGLTAPQAIGYKEVVAFLRGECSCEDSKSQIKQSTRRYAKRQLSWLRSDAEIHWIDITDLSNDAILEEALNIIEPYMDNHSTV